MSVVSKSEPQHQSLVNARFDAESEFWRAIYTDDAKAADTVGRLVIRERHAAALHWVDRLRLPDGSRALELGAGAGMFSIALARRGFRVDATDASEEMVRLIGRNAGTARAGEAVTAARADATALPFAGDAFDLTVALGVLSWLDNPGAGVREMARVTRPGGYVLFTTFNRMQLIALLDPLRNPWVRPLKLKLKRMVERTGLLERSTDLAYHDRQYVDGMVAGAGLTKVRSTTIGFGPFSLMQKEILPRATSMTVHRRAQKLADLGVPVLRHGGMFYLVLARKPAR